MTAGEVLQVILALATIGLSVIVYRGTNKLTQYQTFDQTYFELLKIRMDQPDLVSAGRPEYDSYACMVWNFIETLYDHTKGQPGKLWETWSPIAFHEARLHRDWFKGENLKRFKEPFVDFAQDRLLRKKRAKAAPQPA